MQWARRLLFLAGLLPALPARAQTTDQLRGELTGVRVDERLGAQVPLDLQFQDENGRTVRLGDYSRQPMLLSLNYTSCPMLCSLQLAGVAKGIKDLRDRAGSDFHVVTLSIDPRERLASLIRAERVYVGQAGGTQDLKRRWHFLSGAEERIRAVADAIGFRYRFDPEAKQFRHQATLVVLTPGGRISSYLHGISYEPAGLRKALGRARRGQVIDEEEQAGLAGFLMSCFAFDPQDHRPLALTVVRASGVLVVVFLFGFIGLFAIRERRSRARAK